MRKVKIKVKQKHIDDGMRKSNSYCPIAMALKDRGYSNINVDQRSMIFETSRSRWYGYLPLVARCFINNFDKKGDGKPFEFEAKITTCFEIDDNAYSGNMIMGTGFVSTCGGNGGAQEL